MEPLRIGVIAPAWVPVPPPVYGGIEAFLDLLVRGLQSLGHDVVLFATGDSTSPVPLRWHFDVAQDITQDMLVEVAQVQAAYESLVDVDIIHDNSLLGPLWSLAAGVRTPVVTTNHGDFTPELRRLYGSVASRVGVIAISQSQRASAPEVPCVGVIHHGIDVEQFPVGAGDGGYVCFLGRMTADKGPHRAIRAARGAGKRLLLAAKMRAPEEREFFAREVEPLLGDDAVYVGEVGGVEKLELLAGAEALVNPIRWPEPFGLAMIEALACGTPVVAHPEGAAPEIVQHGRTGYLCADEEVMVQRLRDLDQLDRGACRRDVEERFAARRMVADHVEVYRRALGRRVIDLRGRSAGCWSPDVVDR